jgi:drug/metabolite transporter (DMT)-like permease
VSVLLALAAAALFALGAVLQQRAAIEAPSHVTGLRLLGELVKRPVWLVGIVSDTLGALAQAAALGAGQLLIVQPLLASYVVFALPLGVLLTHQKVGRRAVVAAVSVAAGLTGFLLLSDPGGGSPDAQFPDWASAAVVVILGCTVLLVIASKLGPAPKAAMRGAAAGLAFALGAALVKHVVTILELDGIEAMLTSWAFYAAVVVAVTTITLNQMALQAGVLAPAVTGSVTLNAIGSVVLGILIFDEQLRASSGSVIGSFISFGLMVGGVLILAGQEAHDPRAVDRAAT